MDNTGNTPGTPGTNIPNASNAPDQQGLTFDAPVQQDTHVGGDGGITFDPAVSQDTPVSTTSLGQQQDQPGLLSRAYETGPKGIVDLAKQVGQRPIDMYHEMIQAFEAGDKQKAAETAAKIVFAGPGGQLLDSKNPLYKAAEAVIMQPVENIKAQYAESRKAGQGKIQAAANVVNPVQGLVEAYQSAKPKIQRDIASGNYAGAVGDVVGAVTQGHRVGAVPLAGAAVHQVGGNVDEDLHNHNYMAVAGDLLGPLMTFGAGKIAGVLGKASDAIGGAASDAAESIKPTSVDVAGNDVPVAATNAQINNPSLPARAVSSFASREGAAKFVKEQVQPAVVQAAKDNFASSGLTAVDDLRNIRGEGPTTVTPTDLQTTDDLVKMLKNEAKTTYSKLDEVAEQDGGDWDTKYGPDSGYQPPVKSTLIDPATNKPFDTGSAEEAPPRPKMFTDLQDQLSEAERVIGSKLSSQTDKAQAIADLPGLRKEMSDFLQKHSDVVSPEELGAANKVYAQGTRYDYIADKLRTAVKGGNEGSSVSKPSAPTISKAQLDSLPSQFDNHFEPGDFKKLLGPEGWDNFKTLSNALTNPETGSTFLKWVSELPFNFGKPVSLPVSAIADHLLFNPKAGQIALRLWKASKWAGNAVGTVARPVANAVTKAAPLVGPVLQNQNQNNVYSTVQNALGGPTTPPKTNGADQSQKQVGTFITPSYGSVSVPGMKQPGNVDISSRPDIKNLDGSHSSVNSMSFGMDAGEVLVPGVGDGTTYPLRRLTPKEALDQYRKTGNNLGTFATPAAADAYGKKLHEDQAKMKVVNGRLVSR